MSDLVRCHTTAQTTLDFGSVRSAGFQWVQLDRWVTPLTRCLKFAKQRKSDLLRYLRLGHGSGCFRLPCGFWLRFMGLPIIYTYRSLLRL